MRSLSSLTLLCLLPLILQKLIVVLLTHLCLALQIVLFRAPRLIRQITGVGSKIDLQSQFLLVLGNFGRCLLLKHVSPSVCEGLGLGVEPLCDRTRLIDLERPQCGRDAPPASRLGQTCAPASGTDRF